MTTDGYENIGGENSKEFAIGKDRSEHHGGRACGVIRSVSENDSGWRAFGQYFQATDYRGKRIRLKGYLKTKGVTGSAGIWMRVDAFDRQAAFDNMERRPVTGTTDWKQYSVVLDVPPDAAAIFIGALMSGAGTTWLDDFKFEVVDPAKVATTGGWLGPNYQKDPVKPQNLSFEPSARPGEIGVPGWSSITGWNDDARLDLQTRRNGKPTPTLRSVKIQGTHMGTYQEFRAEAYRGKRVEFRAFVQSPGKIAGGVMLAIPGGGQWAVADIPQFVEKGAEWVKDTRTWKPVSAVLDVPNWAHCIQVGFQLDSPGQMWFSEASFKVVDPKSTPVTFCSPMPTLYTPSALKLFPKRPTNLDFEG